MSTARLARNAASSAAQVIVSAGLLFELYRFVTQYLSVAQIGIWSLVLASSAIGRLADLGLGSGIVRFVALDFGNMDYGRAAVTLWMTSAAVAVIVAVLCVVLFPILWIAIEHVVRDGAAVSVARHLLPFGLASLWLSMVATLFLGALDGIQRTDLRAGITVAAGIVQLLSAYLLVPRYGLTGLAFAQVVQGIVVMLAAAFFMLKILDQGWNKWFKFDRDRIREMLRYGGGLQIAALGQMLFDPTVKVLLSLYGGLAITGYYEMASRMITQFRAVIVSAFQMLVPYVAGANPNQAEAASIYLVAYRVLVFLAVPYYAAITMVLAPLLALWTGQSSSQFYTVALLSLAGWAANTMVAPAYFLYLALGRVRWPVISQLTIGAVNLALGIVGGLLFSANGVLTAAAIALGAGSMLTLAAFQRDYGIPLSDTVPRESRWLILTSAASVVLSVILGYRFSEGSLSMSGYALPVAASMLLVVLSVWRNVHRQSVTQVLRRLVMPV